MIGATAYKVTITTIHGFCNDIIQAYPEHFLAYRASRPIDDITQIELIEKLLSKGAYPSLVSEYDRSYYVPHIRDRISKLKQE